jgi:hypothetical protein
MWWILLVMFANGEVGASLVETPMSRHQCEQAAEATVQELRGAVKAIKCVPRIPNV